MTRDASTAKSYGLEPDWDKTLSRMPDAVQEVLKVPHLPQQPLKEMFARMKAMDPRPFEDKHFEEIYRDLPKDEKKMRRYAKAKEDAYIHTEQDCQESQACLEWIY